MRFNTRFLEVPKIHKNFCYFLFLTYSCFFHFIVPSIFLTWPINLGALITSFTIFLWESAANFFLVKPPDQKKAFEVLKAEGILVRPREGENIEGTIRVSVGTLQDTERFIKAYLKMLEG